MSPPRNRAASGSVRVAGRARMGKRESAVQNHVLICMQGIRIKSTPAGDELNRNSFSNADRLRAPDIGSLSAILPINCCCADRPKESGCLLLRPRP